MYKQLREAIGQSPLDFAKAKNRKEIVALIQSKLGK